MIDDCEYIDKQSWELIEPLIEIKTLIFIATMGRDRPVDKEYTKKIMYQERCKMVHLHPLPVTCLGALVCQILGVYAISPELEKAIQNKSRGNPGWVESFLISSIQDNVIWILNADLREVNDLGLVCPPLYMMARLTTEETKKWKQIMEEARRSSHSMTEDGWKKYVDSCRDSFLNITVREQMEDMTRNGKVPICVISPDFRVGDTDGELSMDAMILKTFDSLNFFEQLLVKCSAILGDQFFRDMLLYVMVATDKRKAALAIQRLFEIKVFTCAKGDFYEDGTTVFRERLVNPLEETELKCKCRGVKIHESCLDLPKYASCGLLQFRTPQFREITHNLLTEQQKKEFHIRAIRYLERDTRKCKSCGGGHFEYFLSQKQDRDMLEMRDGIKKHREEGVSWTGSFESFSNKSVRSRTASVYSGHSGVSSVSGSKTKKSTDDKSITSLSTTHQVATETMGQKMLKHFCGTYLIHKYKRSYSLTRAFSTEDFTDCQCALILSTSYAQLIEHCRGANEFRKALYAMINYSYVSISNCNVPLALKILEDAFQLLSQKSRETFEQNWKLSLMRGKIYTLIGYCQMELGQLFEAMTNLHNGLKEFGWKYPKGLRKRLKVCSHTFKQFIGFQCHTGMFIRRLGYWASIYTSNLCECLSYLCSLYMIQNDWDNAIVTGTASLSKCVMVFNDFQAICNAFSNMLHIYIHEKKWNFCLSIEVHALRLCYFKKTALEAEDIKSVSRLYRGIFYSRLYRSDIERAVHMGYIVLKMCTSIRANDLILSVLPLLLHCLLLRQHFSNTYSILQEIEFFSTDDPDSSGKVWYYALCVTLQLETGYAVLPYHSCESFYQMEGENWVTIRDPDARRRFYIVMWLWCVRNERWEAASIWCLKTSDFFQVAKNDSLANKITMLYLLEGVIIFLVSKLDKRNIQAVTNAEAQIKHLFKAIESDATKSTNLIFGRLYHLKAYYKFVRGNDSEAVDLLKKAKKCASKCGNTLEVGWIDHSMKAWTRTLPAILVEFWKDHSESDNLLDFQDIEMNEGKIGFFTLPTPLYV